jgi:hypothetical protein
MTDKLLIRGTNLRYALTLYLHLHGRATLAALISGLDHWGLAVGGRPSKSVSDALRWEVRRERVRRIGRGIYGPGPIPRSTEHRIHQRVLSLRAKAQEAALDGEATDCRLGFPDRCGLCVHALGQELSPDGKPPRCLLD